LLQLVRATDSRSQRVSNGVIDASIPSPAREEFDKAIALLTKNRIADSVVHLQRAIDISPRFIEARLKLGAVLMDLERWEEAEKMLRTTLELDSTAANALFALGEIYLQRNRIKDAEEVLRQGLQIDDSSPVGHLNLARVYWEQARGLNDLNQLKPFLEKSYTEVNRAIELKANVAGAHLLRGNLLLRASRTTDALKEFDEYLRLEPDGAFADETRALQERIRKATAQHVTR